MEACVDVRGPRASPLEIHRWCFLTSGVVACRAAGSSLCRTAQWHTAVCWADPSHVVRPCFEFQGSITFPLSSAPAGTSGSLW